MAMMKNRIDFVAVIVCRLANPGGDPLNGNRPRVNFQGFGELSDVCIKRKIRNRLQDMGLNIFVQSDGRETDEFRCLSKRAESVLKGCTTLSEKQQKACEAWIDVRAFGQVFAFKAKKGDTDGNNAGESFGVRGPVTIQVSESVDPIDIVSMQITKSVSNEEGEKKGSDTMGTSHRVDFGVYLIKGSINPYLAEKTGLTDEDVEKIKEALLTLFENDESAARPAGSMEVRRLFWFDHGCKRGKYNTAEVHRSVVVKRKTDDVARSFDDYEVGYVPLEGLEPQVFEQ